MTVGTIRPIALSRLSQESLSVMISRRCHSALYGCLVHDFLPEVSHGSLARVQVPARHSRCGASKALRARGSPPSHSILLDLNSSQMVQGIRMNLRLDLPLAGLEGGARCGTAFAGVAFVFRQMRG